MTVAYIFVIITSLSYDTKQNFKCICIKQSNSLYAITAHFSMVHAKFTSMFENSTTHCIMSSRITALFQQAHSIIKTHGSQSLFKFL
jgi:hypothetical protein